MIAAIDRDRHGPEHEIPLPALLQHRQHQRNGQRGGQDLADQQAVGVDRGGEADALRHPGAHQRRQRRLHHRDAERRDHGADIKHRDVRPDAAQHRAEGAEHEPDQQRGERAEPRDHQRAGDGGAREQHHRQAGQDADLRLRQVQVVVDQRNDRRHREDGQPQRDAREPEQQQRPQRRDHGSGARGGAARSPPRRSRAAVKAAVTKKIARGAPWSSSAPNSSGARMPAMLIAGGDEGEHLAERARRRDLAHDHVARRHDHAAAQAGERHHQRPAAARRDRRCRSAARRARCAESPSAAMRR